MEKERRENRKKENEEKCKTAKLVKMEVNQRWKELNITPVMLVVPMLSMVSIMVVI